MDYKGRQQMPPLNQFYGSMGNMSGSPAGPMGLVQPGQSMTPPPSLSVSSSNLSLGKLHNQIDKINDAHKFVSNTECIPRRYI